MLYDYGFKYFRMGYASAQSWILFAIIMCLTLLVFKSSHTGLTTKMAMISDEEVLNKIVVYMFLTIWE